MSLLLIVLSLASDVPGISNAEAARHLRADPTAFASADRNGDGRIDDAELLNVRRALAAQRDGDDRAAAPSLRIGSRDANGDGALTPQELYAEAR